MRLCTYSKDILNKVLEKFHQIPIKNEKVACRNQAMQRVKLKKCTKGIPMYHRFNLDGKLTKFESE